MAKVSEKIFATSWVATRRVATCCVTARRDATRRNATSRPSVHSFVSFRFISVVRSFVRSFVCLCFVFAALFCLFVFLVLRHDGVLSYFGHSWYRQDDHPGGKTICL